MKKSLVKSLSVFLALVLILSALPMSAFAAKVEVHEHSTSCCSEEDGIMPAMAPCEDGAHVYYLSETRQYTDCGGVHRVDVLNVYTCSVCARFYIENTGISFYEAHSYTKVQVGTDPDSGLAVYSYSCACGSSYYGN